MISFQPSAEEAVAMEESAWHLTGASALQVFPVATAGEMRVLLPA